MKKYVFFISLFGIVLVNGCEKNNESTSVEGYIRNYYNDEPIDSVKVVLTDGIYAGTPPPDFKYPKKKISYTDKSGYFQIQLDNPDESPFFYASKIGFDFDPEWDDGVAVGVHTIGYGSHEKLEFYLKPDTTFCATIINNGIKIDSLIFSFLDFKRPEWSNSGDDKVYVYGDNEINNELHFFGNEQWNICESNFVYFRTIDRYLKYKINYKKQDNWHTLLDSINLDETDRDKYYVTIIEIH